MKIFIQLITLAAILIIPLSAKDSSAKGAIESMIEAYGGEKNITKLNSYTQQWHVQTMVSDTNGTDNRMVVMPTSLTTQLIYPHKKETRILHRDYGTKELNNKTIEAKGPMLDAMRLQLMRLYTPSVLKTKLSYISTSEDKDHYILSLRNNGVVAKYFVDKQSHLVKKVIGQLKMGTQSMEFLTLYDDYKKIDGVMVAHKEIKYAGSVNTAVMRLQKMRFNNYSY